MQKLLNEISNIPGVAGSCIFDRNKGIVCRKLNIFLPKDITDNIGFNFIRLLQMAAMNKLDVRSAQFRFDRYWLVGIPLYKGIILLAICDLQANCSLVASSAAMLAEEMRQELEPPSVSRPEGLTPGMKQEDFSSDGEEDIQKYFTGIENALAAAIGPVAEMIMSDCVYRWKQSSSPSLAGLSEFLDILADEIEDSTLIAGFRSQLKHLP